MMLSVLYVDNTSLRTLWCSSVCIYDTYIQICIHLLFTLILQWTRLELKMCSVCYGIGKRASEHFEINHNHTLTAS